jgi:hypothetical protein
MSCTRQKKLAAFLLIMLSVASNSQAKEGLPAIDLSKFPKLEGRVTQVLGSVNSFVPPQAAEPFRVDLAALTKATALEFDLQRKSYIPLAAPVSVESIHYYSNGKFQNLRLMSQGKTPGRVIIDIVPHSGQGQNKVQVWVVVEYGVTTGVALLECELKGEFPDRPN